MALSGAEYWKAVRAAFPGRYTFQRILLFWPRYFKFFPSCSYTVFALPFSEISDMPRTKSSLAVSQDYFTLALPCLGYNLPWLRPWAPMNKWARATNYWAPHILLYIFKCIHAYALSYKLVYISRQSLEKIQLVSNFALCLNLCENHTIIIHFSLCHVST